MKRDTARHLRYACGYIDLGLLNEASDELEAIEFVDRFVPDVLQVRVTLHMEAKHWELVVGAAQQLVAKRPESEQGWISWAYALRELNRLAEAKAVLLDAESRHGGTSATLHYNLACYHCLLGEFADARARLQIACRMHPPLKEDAITDPDLAAL